MDPQILYNIAEKVLQKKSAGHDVIKLNIGEPDQEPPKLLISTINSALYDGRATYGPAAGEPKLRDLLAKLHNVREENVLIGPGSKFLVYATLRLISQSKKTGVIVPLPAWSAFHLMLKDLNISAVYIKTLEKDGWQLSTESLNKVINKNTNSILITNPNNPTSTSAVHIKDIQKIAAAKGITLIKDCAYQALSFKDEKNTTDLNQTIEIHTFSKKFCMTGFRIGYLLAQKETIEKLTKFVRITVNNVPLFIQDGAIKLLEEKQQFPQTITSIYKKRAQMVGEMLKLAGITFVLPDAGFYIFANIKKDAEKFCLKIIDRGVAIVPGTAFGPYPTYVRISLTEEENRLKKGIQIITDSLNS